MIMVQTNIANELVYFKVCSREFRTTVVAYLDILMISRIIFRRGPSGTL